MLAWPIACWLLSALTYVFLFSQYSVIMALGNHIKVVIEPRLEILLGSSNLLGEQAETHGYMLVLLDRSRILLIAGFLIGPLLLDLFAVYLKGPHIWLHVTTGAGSVIIIQDRS